jgi:hypothetical protein
MDTKLETLINKSFDYYDKQNITYNDLLEYSNIEIQTPNSIIRSDGFDATQPSDSIMRSDGFNTNSLIRETQSTSQQVSQYVEEGTTEDMKIVSQQKLPYIKFNNNNFNYEILGIFDMKTSIWIWSWVFPFMDKLLNKESKGLLKYALNLNIGDIDSKDHYFLKTQLTNSRIYMKDKFQLDILLATCSYILGNNIDFIYPDVKILSPTHTVIYFLLIK